jgi:hypothetical protein
MFGGKLAPKWILERKKNAHNAGGVQTAARTKKAAFPWGKRL